MYNTPEPCQIQVSMDTFAATAVPTSAKPTPDPVWRTTPAFSIETLLTNLLFATAGEQSTDLFILLGGTCSLMQPDGKTRLHDFPKKTLFGESGVLRHLEGQVRARFRFPKQACESPTETNPVWTRPLRSPEFFAVHEFCAQGRFRGWSQHLQV